MGDLLLWRKLLRRRQLGAKQGAAWDLIFMANKKQQKKFPTKVTKKDKKKFKPFLDTHKKIQKKGFSNTVSQKSLKLKWQKKLKKKIQLSLNSDDIIIIGKSNRMWVQCFWLD